MTRLRLKRNYSRSICFFLISIIFFIIALEYGLRAIKSVQIDGVLHLSSPSVNNEYNSKFGWLSPKSRSYEKEDDCYGSGRVSYNEAGFRAPPMRKAETADLRVCILGDSYMHGYQMPDGLHLPHLLSRELEELGFNPYVLPLAVGGFGTTQQWMLFEEYCMPINPDILVWHWVVNDPTNNNYMADRYSGPNNVRLRPYYEDGEIIMRRPYMIHIHDSIDSMMVLKLLNGLILRWTAAPKPDQLEYREEGWRVAEAMLARGAGAMERPIALVESSATRAIEMFRRQGFEIASYGPFPEDYMCKPKDSHPNTKGHRQMLEALLPVLKRQLYEE